ncbi:hypothetical protein CLV98_10244 [Dyadobacter jejuensis]|uniref:DUF4382 domain-containing protein n=1 Tax=Dyadobacter jejuensis TaxID=1082580 RepID=A0A316ANU3_9BACT|nr:hypothetical protein [Dyadobacter jejuensis]PWJ59212.1 hypothetical protein CLV98_10244 [Dyadobacter jejuensis]
MKTIKSIYSLLLILALLATSCSDDGGGNLPDLSRVPIPLLTQVENSDILIQDPAIFQGKFSVDLLFPEDVAPKFIDVVITMNGDYKTIKVLESNLTSFPTVIDLDAAKIASAFGINVSDIVPGDYFEVGANINTVDGKLIPAFAEVGNQFSADIANFPGSNLKIKYPVVCPLDLDEFVGEFTIDDPNFWEASYPVTIEREGENVLVITGFVEDPDAVIKVTIDPQTTKASVSKQVFAPVFFSYTNGAVEGSGEINACENSITLNLTYTVDQGSFGSYGLTIKK